MITGDKKETAISIAREVGLLPTAENAEGRYTTFQSLTLQMKVPILTSHLDWSWTPPK
jgi:magnesium-transporting ATPase (P-type)